MIFNAIIGVFSLLLLVYWFRYSCVLVLRNQPKRDYARQVATANHLQVFNVQNQLAAAVGGTKDSLDGLDKMLDRDYRLLLYLIRHAASFKTAGLQIEQIILMCNYRIASVLYRLTKRISVAQGAKQLAEMAEIITRFADLMGERAALSAS
ncbi:MAG: hypothetical protein M3Y27_06520 [Acidobacteriota bacterium]|nr:hypothetical protein [Acidobacteriota bacterium]